MKRWLLSLLFLIPFLGLTSCTANYKLSRIGAYKEVPPEAYYEILKQGDVNIIDVRTKSEYRKTHIEGAVNASYFSGHFSEIVSAYNLDPKKRTLIYCETQHRSPLAANQLYKLGFKNIIDLEKGMMYWRKHEFPYEKETSDTK